MNRRWRPVVIATAVALLVVGVSLLTTAQRRGGAVEATTLTFQAASAVRAEYKLETVSTAADLERGLSGRSGLKPGTGMLFEFSGASQARCIWMKDMKFAIDVVWLDQSDRVVKTVAAMQPSSYPQIYCASAVRVVELPLGSLRVSGIQNGSQLRLQP